MSESIALDLKKTEELQGIPKTLKLNLSQNDSGQMSASYCTAARCNVGMAPPAACNSTHSCRPFDPY